MDCPKYLYLQDLGGTEITWCGEKINDDDVCYVRAGKPTSDAIDDLRRQLAQRDSRIAELEAKLAAASRLARDSAEAAGEMAETATAKPLRHLLNCVNAVTAKHRHGQPISRRRLDDLCNAQLDYEEAAHD